LSLGSVQVAPMGSGGSGQYRTRQTNKHPCLLACQGWSLLLFGASGLVRFSNARVASCSFFLLHDFCFGPWLSLKRAALADIFSTFLHFLLSESLPHLLPSLQHFSLNFYSSTISSVAIILAQVYDFNRAIQPILASEIREGINFPIS
jgi:hypothetical protein